MYEKQVSNRIDAGITRLFCEKEPNRQPRDQRSCYFTLKVDSKIINESGSMESFIRKRVD